MNGITNENQLKAKQLYNKVVDQEKELRNLCKRKSPFDRNIVALRNSIKDTYEQIIFLDYDFAVTVDIEQSIWKNIFYRVIEEYRKKLRRCVMGDDKDSPTNKEELGRVQLSFRNFLGTASAFYTNLIQRFQQTFHLVLDGSVSYMLSSEDGLHRSYLSCHRCYIFLGDIARYHKDLQDDSTNDLKNAENYYKRALLLVPDNGNPHNQLAVLATYADNEFNAVYRYFRSLAVIQPFSTARDNLTVLFEKNKTKMDAFPTTFPDGGISSESVPILLCRYVRLLGILFTKTDLDMYDTLKNDVMSMLNGCMTARNVLDVATVLKIVTVAIFTVHNAKSENTPKSSYADISNRSVIQRTAIMLVLEISTIILRDSRFFGVVWVVLEWFRVHPDYLKNPDAETSLEVWTTFWDTFAKAANHYNRSPMSSPAPLPVYLPEEAELRGFRPLFLAFKSLPTSVLVPPAGAGLNSVDLVTSSPNFNFGGAAGQAALLTYRAHKFCEFAAYAIRVQPRLLYFDIAMGLYSVFPPSKSTTTSTPPALVPTRTHTPPTSVGGARMEDFNQSTSQPNQNGPLQTMQHFTPQHQNLQQNGEVSEEEDEDDEDNVELNQRASQYEFVSSPEDEVYHPPPNPKKLIDFGTPKPDNTTSLPTSLPVPLPLPLPVPQNPGDEEVDEEVILFRPPGSDLPNGSAQHQIGSNVDEVVAPQTHQPQVGIIGEKPGAGASPNMAAVHPHAHVAPTLAPHGQYGQVAGQPMQVSSTVFNSSLFNGYNPTFGSPTLGGVPQPFGARPVPNLPNATMLPNLAQAQAQGLGLGLDTSAPQPSSFFANNNTSSYSLFAGHDSTSGVIDRPFSQPLNPHHPHPQALQQAGQVRSPILPPQFSPALTSSGLGLGPTQPLEWLRKPAGSPIMNNNNLSTQQSPYQLHQQLFDNKSVMPTPQPQQPQQQTTPPPNYSPFAFPFSGGRMQPPLHLQQQHQLLQLQHQQVLQQQQSQQPTPQQQQQQQVPPQYRTKNPFITT